MKVKPLSRGPLLSSHPLLNRQLWNSQKVVPLFTVNLTSIKRSPPLSWCGHHLQFTIYNWLILLYFTSIKRSHSLLQCDISGYFSHSDTRTMSSFFQAHQTQHDKLLLWTKAIYCMHATVPFLLYFILHLGNLY